MRKTYQQPILKGIILKELTLKSAVFGVASSLLFALAISSRAEAHGLRVLTEVDRSTFIETTGIDDFVLPTPETFFNYESLWVGGVGGSTLQTFIVTGEDTGGRYTLAEDYIPVNSGPPRHIHTREDEWFYVTSGELLFSFEDQTLTATPGTLIFSPRNHLHGLINSGNEVATILNLWQQSGIEGFFRETGDPVTPANRFNPPVPPNPEKFLAAAPKYGIIIPPPPQPVPEPSGLLGTLASGILGAISILKRKHKSV